VSSDLDELYQEIILDHNRRPRNFGPLPSADHQASGYNPLCGDRVTVFLKLGDGETIDDIAFEGSGCAISTASASMMTEALRGKPVAHAQALFRKMHALLTGVETRAEASEEVGQLAALIGVRNYPMRVKCATLAWHALQSAISSPAAAPPA
jgi:nitrogen fixation NifU-like protein